VGIGAMSTGDDFGQSTAGEETARSAYQWALLPGLMALWVA